jgi:hypothetical protein
MSLPAHAHGPALAPFLSDPAHGRPATGNSARQPLTLRLTHRSRRSRSLTLTIPTFFRRGIRERGMTGDPQ